jgi:DNA-binding GntR family transcriptional regulator
MWFMFAWIYFNKVKRFALTSHRDIFLALKEREGKKAAELIGEHIRHGAQKIVEHFENKGGSADKMTSLPLEKL